MEEVLNKRSVYLQKKEECTRKIRELGSLPTDALEKIKGKDSKYLMDKLKEVNSELKGYSSVNKKALDQYLKPNCYRVSFVFVYFISLTCAYIR